MLARCKNFDNYYCATKEDPDRGGEEAVIELRSWEITNVSRIFRIIELYCLLLYIYRLIEIQPLWRNQTMRYLIVDTKLRANFLNDWLS